MVSSVVRRENGCLIILVNLGIKDVNSFQHLKEIRVHILIGRSNSFIEWFVRCDIKIEFRKIVLS